MPKPPSSVHRALRVLKLLGGRSLHGLANGEIAKAIDETPVNVSRALAALEDEGLATRLDTGRWALGIKAAQLGVSHLNELELAEQRIKEIKQRTMAGAMK